MSLTFIFLSFMISYVKSACMNSTCYSLPSTGTNLATLGNGVLPYCVTTASAPFLTTCVSLLTAPDTLNCYDGSSCPACPSGLSQVTYADPAGASLSHVACMPCNIQPFQSTFLASNTFATYNGYYQTNGCKACVNNSVVNEFGTGCDTCPENSYVTSPASGTPWPSADVGAPLYLYRFYCQTCPAGTYVNTAYHWITNNGVNPCLSCPVGTYGTVDGEGCKACPLGMTSSPGYNVPTNQPVTTCSSCPGGTFNSSAGICSDCPIGKYSLAASTGCTICMSDYLCTADTSVPVPLSSIPRWNQRKSFKKYTTSAAIYLQNPVNTTISTYYSPPVIGNDASEVFISSIKTLKSNYQLLAVIVCFSVMGFYLLVSILLHTICLSGDFLPNIRSKFQALDLFFDMDHYVGMKKSPTRTKTPIGGVATICTIISLSVIASTSVLDFVYPTTIVPGATPSTVPFINNDATTMTVNLYGYSGPCYNTYFLEGDPTAVSGTVSANSIMDATNSVCNVILTCTGGCVFNTNVKIVLTPGGRAQAIDFRIATPGYADENGAVKTDPYWSYAIIYANGLDRTFFDENTFSFTYVPAMIVTSFNASYVTSIMKIAGVKAGLQENVYSQMLPKYTNNGVIGGVTVAANIVVSPLSYQLTFVPPSPIVLISSILSLFVSAMGVFKVLMVMTEERWWTSEDSKKETSDDSNSGLLENLVKPVEEVELANFNDTRVHPSSSNAGLTV